MGRVVAALDFGGSKIAAAVADEHGRRLAETTVPTEPERGAEWNLMRGLDAARSLLDGRRAAAVGACTFGIPAGNGVGLAPAIEGWEKLALGRELVSAFSCDVVRIATDVKAAAEVEVRSGALAGHDPAIYLNLGTGLAVALVVGGRVVSGANGAAGEIGYNLRRSGARLEPLVSGLGLAAEAERRTGRRLSAADVFAQEAADPQLAELVDEFAAELSFQLVNLAIAIDPSRIAVGGGMIRAWERVVVPLHAALEESVPFPPELVPAAFPFDAPLVGAIALAVEAVTNKLGPERRNGT